MSANHDLQLKLKMFAQEISADLSGLEPAESKELLGSFVSELFYCVAEQERRDVRLQKQAAGIAAAKRRGVQFGRRPLTLPEEFADTVRRWEEGSITAESAAKVLGMSRQTFHRKAKEYNALRSQPQWKGARPDAEEVQC